jgi:hypothetical protein
MATHRSALDACAHPRGTSASQKMLCGTPKVSSCRFNLVRRLVVLRGRCCANRLGTIHDHHTFLHIGPMRPTLQKRIGDNGDVPRERASQLACLFNGGLTARIQVADSTTRPPHRAPDRQKPRPDTRQQFRRVLHRSDEPHPSGRSSRRRQEQRSNRRRG